MGIRITFQQTSVLLATCLGLGAMAPRTAEAACATSRPDAVDAVLVSVDESWSNLAGSDLSSAPYRDKARLVADLEQMLERERAKERDRKRLDKALAKRAGEVNEPGLTWRLHELRARVLAPIDADGARDALEDALATYPQVDYVQPFKQSSFHHLLVELASSTLKGDDPEAARELLVSTVRDDVRLQAFYPEPLERLYIEEGRAAELHELLEALASAAEPRLPELARELRARPPLDARYCGGDPEQLYLVLGADAEVQGPRQLVVIMAGGSGQALDFLPWLRQLTEPLTDRYLFAVLSAPVWSDEQAAQVVWVTERTKREYRARFAVEDFARGVAAELRAADGNLDRAFLFAWSSGGPATYATVLDRDNTFAGAYVLSSVFKPEQLDLRRASDRRFFLEQGRSDTVTAFRFAQEAATTLADAGAAVRLAPFDGGHGFAMPDPAASLERALAWLVEDSD
ncbi:hypothetical protein [Engelhardtia mirabilis]